MRNRALDASDPVTDHVFMDTPWSVFSVIRDGDGEGTQYAAAVDAVYRQYQPAVYAWLRRRGITQARAEDLSQDFTTDKLFGPLFKSADKSIGAFRVLLLSALKNHLNDQYDRQKVRDPATVAGKLQDRGRPPRDVAGVTEADAEFDRQWALRALEATLATAEESFRHSDQQELWNAFERRVLQPIRTQQPAPSLADVADACGLRDARHAARAIRFVKHRCRGEFARQVAMVTDRKEDFREELAYYRQLLSGTADGDIV